MNGISRLLVFVISMVIFTSCFSDGSSKIESWFEDSNNDVTTVDELVGKWERRNSEGRYYLSIMAEGTGKLISYEQTEYTTEKFKYKVTDKGIEVDWGKLKKETYHAVLTVDDKYLVLDNGRNVFVYKRKGGKH